MYDDLFMVNFQMCPRHDQMSRTEDWLYDVRASDEEIAAYYATAWLGYLSQENGTAGEDCITIGCISLEVRHNLDIKGNWQTDQSIVSCKSFWMFILGHCPSRETFDEIPNWPPTPLFSTVKCKVHWHTTDKLFQELDEVFADIITTPEFVYILDVSFIIRNWK